MKIRIGAMGLLLAAASGAESGVPRNNVRIVKFGIEHQRNQDGGQHNINSYHRLKCIRDPQSGTVTVTAAKDDLQRTREVDVDGDGRTGDDEIAFHAFDLSPDNPLSPVAPFYDTSSGSQRIYGGVSVEVADCEPGGAYFTEDGMNGTEEGTGFQPRRNWTLFREAFEPYSPFRLHGVWLWQKFDFMNGGASNRVSFDERSELRHLVMRYYLGIEGMRWVVRNGERFYISEDVYRFAGEKAGDGGGKIHACRPALVKWTEYHPKAPFDIVFDPKTATFERRTFDDVTAVGWYLFKEQLSPVMIGCKWYTFEADAVVSGPDQPGENLDMLKAGDLYISKTAVPYETWRKVHRLVRYNGWAGPRGFSFRSYGDMGSMACPDADGNYRRHGQQEPVTQIRFADTLAWCNALSQQESRTPCYYTDPEFREVYREVTRHPLYPEDQRTSPVIYVKWDADGYRLPTADERTALSDAPGDIWEMIWDQGDRIDLAGLSRFTVAGGQKKQSAGAYGDRPFSGSPFISFRVVRRDAGGPAPATRMPNPATRIPVWGIPRDLITAPVPQRQLTAPLAKPWLEIIEVNGTPWGKYEVTYEKWRPVYDWAVAHGYEFDTQGEMGSMAYWGFGADWKPGDHGPDEPVTGITHYDACIWLNALSELEGLEPVYYADKALTKPLRKAFLFRPLHLLRGETDPLGGQNAVFNDAFWQPVVINPKATGYRLPTQEEYLPLLKQTPAPWTDKGWFFDNSGLTTHPAGAKGTDTYGLCDLFGNVAELGETVPKHKGGGEGYARRIGGGFFDVTLNLLEGLASVEPTTNCRGLGYPDTGFRAVLQKGGKK